MQPACTVTLSLSQDQDVSLHLFPTGLLCLPKQPSFALRAEFSPFAQTPNLSADSAPRWLGCNFSSDCLADGYSFQLVVCFNSRWSYSYLVWVGEVGRGMRISHKLCIPSVCAGQDCATGLDTYSTVGLIKLPDFVAELSTRLVESYARYIYGFINNGD